MLVQKAAHTQLNSAALQRKLSFATLQKEPGYQLKRSGSTFGVRQAASSFKRLFLDVHDM